MSKNHSNEITSNIACIRELEDCIRVTKKYTKGAFRKAAVHPIQGEDFPSKVLTEYYEVYPTLEVSWNMPAGKAIDWLWGDIRHIDVHFKYDYRVNVASMLVKDGHQAVDELCKGIPNFKLALGKAIEFSKVQNESIQSNSYPQIKQGQRATYRHS